MTHMAFCILSTPGMVAHAWCHVARVVACTNIDRRESDALGWVADLQLAGRLDGEELLREGFNLGGVLQQLVQDEVQQALAVVAASAVHQLQQRFQFEACTQYQHRISTRILCKSEGLLFVMP